MTTDLYPLSLYIHCRLLEMTV